MPTTGSSAHTYGWTGAGGSGGGLGGVGGSGLGGGGMPGGGGGEDSHVSNGQHDLQAFCCATVPPQQLQYCEKAMVPMLRSYQL